VANDCIKAKIKKLLAEGMEKEQAVAVAYKHCKKGDSLATGTIVAEGYYPYMTSNGTVSLQYKEYDELVKAYPEDEILPLFKSHDDHELVGVVYDMTADAASRSIKAKIYSENGVEGGLSAEFFDVEVECEQGTCQRDIKPTAVALAGVPRNPRNRVDGENQMEQEKIDALEAELKEKSDALEAITAERDALKAKLDALEAEKEAAERAGLVQHLTGRVTLREGETWDSICIKELRVMRDTIDRLVPVTVPEKKMFDSGTDVKPVTMKEVFK